MPWGGRSRVPVRMRVCAAAKAFPQNGSEEPQLGVGELWVLPSNTQLLFCYQILTNAFNSLHSVCKTSLKYVWQEDRVKFEPPQGQGLFDFLVCLPQILHPAFSDCWCCSQLLGTAAPLSPLPGDQ